MVVFEKNVSDLFFSNVPVDLVAELEAQPFVKDAQPVLFSIIAAPDRPVVTCFGIQASDGRLKKGEWLQGSAADFKDDGEGVVLGERAADFLKAKVGGTIELGQGVYPVAGVVRLENGFENGGVFMPLLTCQKAFHKEGVCSVVTVALAAGHESSEVKAWMAKNHEKLTALENEEFSRSYSQFKIMKTTAWVVGGCAFLLGGLSVTNTMILSVFSRIKEIAIARVCGFSRSAGGADDFRRVAAGLGHRHRRRLGLERGRAAPAQGGSGFAGLHRAEHRLEGSRRSDGAGGVHRAARGDVSGVLRRPVEAGAGTQI